NSDKDDIFPVPGYRRMAPKVRRLYGLYGAAERFDLLETKGPHKDTPELRAGAFAGMDTGLKGEEGKGSDPDRPQRAPKQLKVFDKLPEDSINDRVRETFRRPAKLDLPEAPAVAAKWWEGRAPGLRKALLGRSFRGWPEKPPALKARAAADVKHDGV